MILFHIIILALVQGITEFLPVSSSGHLVITHTLMGQNVTDLCWEQNRVLDVAVHIGTLFSVLVYFHKDIREMLFGLTNVRSSGFQKSFNIIVASIPVILAGLALSVWKPNFLCILQITAWTTLIFGIVLWWADKKDVTKTSLEAMTMKDAILIGLAQTLALIPGTSRSGITMTASRFLGYSRTDAAHFSLLLAIIAISGAGVLGIKDIVEMGDNALTAGAGIAVILSFLSGLAAIALMMEWLKKASFKPFAIYRIIIGIAMLALIYAGIL